MKEMEKFNITATDLTEDGREAVFVAEPLVSGSLNLRKVCTIISDYPKEIESFIIHKLHRSATKQNAFGSYTQENKTVLMSVLTRGEANALRSFVKQVDPHAFITIVNSSEIIGKGFRSI